MIAGMSRTIRAVVLKRALTARLRTEAADVVTYAFTTTLRLTALVVALAPGVVYVLFRRERPAGGGV